MGKFPIKDLNDLRISGIANKMKMKDLHAKMGKEFKNEIRPNMALS